MTLWALAAWVAAGVAATFGMERVMNAYMSWKVNRALRRRGTADLRLEPERRFVVHLGETAVVCERPDGTREQVTWGELQRVEIVSTSAGPMVPDTFWLLVGDVGGCAIPWGASGEAALLERLQRLPGFDNQAVIGAASDVTDGRRVCWERSSKERDEAGREDGP